MKYIAFPLFIALLTGFVFACKSYPKTTNTQPAENMNDLTTLWKQIDSLEVKGLVQSAFEKTEEFIALARKENKPDYLVAGVMRKAGYMPELKEGGLPEAIAFVEEEINASTYPVKPLLQSYLAQSYSNYLEQNIWKFRDRTDVGQAPSDDITTWTIRQFEEKIRGLYWASLSDEKLKTEPIANFAFLLADSTNSHLRPTLFDLLAVRALDHFAHDASWLTKPAYQFEMDQPEVLAPVEVFVNWRAETKDTASYQLQVLKLYQELLSLRLAQAEEYPEALLDVDLKRLDYALGQAVFENKDKAYLEALDAWSNKLQGSELQTLVQNKQAAWYQKKGSNYNALKDKFTEGEDPAKWYLKKAVEICEKAIANYPESKGAGLCKMIKARIEIPELSITLEEYVPPGRPVLCRLEYKNLDEATVRVFRMNQKRNEEWRLIGTENNATEKRIRFLSSFPAVQTRVFELPNDGDYQEHAVELGLDELSYGEYLVVVSEKQELDQSSAVHYTRIQATNLGLWQRDDESGRPHFVVYHRQNGGPVQGVSADFFEDRYDSRTRTSNMLKFGTSSSDKDGFIFFPSGKNVRRFSMLLHYKDDSLRLERNFYNYPGDSRNKAFERSIVLLDREIYRPGQTVYFKVYGLYIDQKRMPSALVNKAVRVTLKDANYQEVSSLELRTNEYGTAHGQFVLPTKGMTGNFRLESSIGGNAVSFRVEDYKRPKFEVVLNNPQSAHRLGDTVVLTGLAKAYAGFNLDGARVKWRVVREARFPWLPWWYRRWFPVSSESREIAHGESMTDANGEFSVSFPALPDKSADPALRPEFHFTIYADVTDLNGETQSNQSVVVVGEEAIRLDAKIGGEVRIDQLNQVQLVTENLNGEQLAVGGEYKLERLKAPQGFFIERKWDLPDQAYYSKDEFKQLFPNVAWELEDQPETWPIERSLLSGEFDSGKSDELNLQAKGLDAGWYVLTLWATDPFGKEVVTRKYFMVYDDQTEDLPTTKPIWTRVNTGPYEPGQTAEALFRAPGKTHVLVELMRGNEVLKRDWIPFGKLTRWTYEVQEADRGNLQFYVNWAGYNRSLNNKHTIAVPWSNKELKISFETFRDKLLPGQEEEWRIRISGAGGEAVAAEVLASMYDASLDAFVDNNWRWDIWPNWYSSLRYNGLAEDLSYANRLKTWSTNVPFPEGISLPTLIGYALDGYARRLSLRLKLESKSYEEKDIQLLRAATPGVEIAAAAAPQEADSVKLMQHEEQKPESPAQAEPPVPQIRENLNETVFFKPEIRTDANGDVLIAFKMNEALTKWKFRLLAHTKLLEAGLAVKEVVTQKDLMVVPNPPRFFREGDEIEYTAKVVNLTDRPLRGNAQLQMVNPLNSMPVYKWLDNPQFNSNFEVPANGSAQLAWRFKVPDVAEVPVIENTVMVWAGDQSDGERNVTPVLSNRMLVTESLPLNVRGHQQKEFVFDRLRNADSPTLSHQGLTLEFTSNPAWYAVQAMPYLMEYPYDCSEQIFSRFYANSLAASVANSTPKIKAVFDRWRNEGAGAMESNLSKNQELKTALLEETPWVLQAQDEETQKRNIALLFDLNRMGDEALTALQKLQERQLPGGGWPWFAGDRDNWYITQYIVEGFGRLRRLGVNDYVTDPQWAEMIRSAVLYCDERMIERYEKLAKQVAEGKAKWEDDHLDYLAAHYLYARSFYLDPALSAGKSNRPSDETALIPLEGKARQVYDYYLSQAEKYWLDRNNYTQGMLALALNRSQKEEAATGIARSLKERAIVNEELGMYWNYPGGWWWYQAPIETHALMIEVFAEVAQDQQAVDELRIWLLKNKQTDHWKTTKATANAVYALLMNGSNWLDSQPVNVKLGNDDWVNRQIAEAQKSAEAGTGYFKLRLNGEDVTPDLANVKVENPNDGIAWGAVYWQYFEQLDKITSFRETPLTLSKSLFRVVNTDEGEKLEPLVEQNLKVGDKVVARIELKVDRDMEYVHMKDMRASAFEPVNVLSTYKWQGGLGYYESTRDASTNFFFSRLPKGSYVFEYRMKVTNRGSFSNGITTIQCMYAPEFTSHSEGAFVEVK